VPKLNILFERNPKWHNVVLHSYSTVPPKGAGDEDDFTTDNYSLRESLRERIEEGKKKEKKKGEKK
jgi:hypothetical protein